MSPSPLRLEVCVGSQTLSLFEGPQLIRQWPCSTSKFGLGFTEGSYRTPVGRLTVKEKHGDGAPAGTIFKSRQPVGLWQPGMDTQEDLVLTRILRLDGRERRNANSFDRYIYVHGTNDEAAVGRPASHGCVRLRNADMIDLYDRVPAGTEVWVTP
jgi:lipoprotein-anchoring transpeptidase ErfK/SrfK